MRCVCARADSSSLFPFLASSTSCTSHLSPFLSLLRLVSPHSTPPLPSSSHLFFFFVFFYETTILTRLLPLLNHSIAINRRQHRRPVTFPSTSAPPTFLPSHKQSSNAPTPRQSSSSSPLHHRFPPAHTTHSRSALSLDPSTLAHGPDATTPSSATTPLPPTCIGTASLWSHSHRGAVTQTPTTNLLPTFAPPLNQVGGHLATTDPAQLPQSDFITSEKQQHLLCKHEQTTLLIVNLIALACLGTQSWAFRFSFSHTHQPSLGTSLIWTTNIVGLWHRVIAPNTTFACTSL